SSSTSVPETVTGTTNQFYVAGLFRTYFRRGPDRSGLTFWVGQLQNGFSRLDVVRGFARPAEYPGVPVARLSPGYFQRAPEAGGRDFWVRQFQAGASESDVQRGFVTAPEYRDTHVSDTSFVGGLYQNMLGRTADATGQSTFAQRLQSGETRDSVALLFLNSAERLGRAVDQFFLDQLGRPSDPTGRQALGSLIPQGVGTPLTIRE